MLSTFLTRTWGLEVPVIGAPMSPMSGGRLAAAVSACGGLGMIGVGSTQPAGQSVGLAERVEPAAAILGRIVRDAEAQLRAAMAMLG